MSLLLKGISKLSGLEIDSDKNWAGHLIQNLGTAVDNADALKKVQAVLQSVMTARGDLLYRGEAEAQRLPGRYGAGYNFLHMKSSGQFEPEWLDLQDLVTYLTGAVNRMIDPPVMVIPMPILSVIMEEDNSGGGRETIPGLTVSVPVISQASFISSPLPVGGGVAHDDDLGDTDETPASNDDIVSDMHLLPSPGAVGDGFYFGLVSQWDWLCLNLGTPGVGTWTLTWKYWNGISWVALTVRTDEINHFRAATGKRWLIFDRPGDWALKNLAGHNLYWIKGEITSYGSMATQPIGTRAWIGQY